MFAPTRADYSAARRAATPSSSVTLRAARHGFCCFTTGRFCATSACDPCGEGTFGSSDISRAGSGVAFYFAWSKALFWIFLLASVFAIPQLAINAGGVVQGAWGLSMLSQTMLGNLAASGVAENTMTSSGGSLSRAIVAAVARVPPTSIPGLYAALDFLGHLVFSLGTLWVLNFVSARKRAEAIDALDSTDFTVAVSGLRRGLLSSCAAGDCSCGSTPLAPEALVTHLEKVAATFTSDFRVARLADGRPEVYFAGAELRAAKLFRRRAELVRMLRDRQRELAKLEVSLGLDASRWTRKTPLYGKIASELGEIVGARARAEKIEADMARLQVEAAESAAQEAREMNARNAAAVAKAARGPSITVDDGIYQDEELTRDGEERARAAASSPRSKLLVTNASTRAISSKSKRVVNARIYDDASSQGTAATEDATVSRSPAGAAGTAQAQRTADAPRITAPNLRRIRQRQESVRFTKLVGGDDAGSSDAGRVTDGGGTMEAVGGSAEKDDDDSHFGESSSEAFLGALASTSATAAVPARAVSAAPPAALSIFSSRRSPLSSKPPAHLVRHRAEHDESPDASVSTRSSASSGDSGFGSHTGHHSDDESDQEYPQGGDRSRAASWTTEESLEEEDAGGSWFPAWLGGSPPPPASARSGTATADDDRVNVNVKSPRSGSGRTRPFSRHAIRAHAPPAEGSGHGAFSEAVTISVVRTHARVYAEELARRNGRPRSALESSPRSVSAVYQARDHVERLKVAPYSIKSRPAYCGICGDRSTFDALDVPCSRLANGWRAAAYEKRIAWLRGRIDDILWDVDSVMRKATSLVPDSDVLEEIGGHSARRAAAAADRANATSPGNARDAALAAAIRGTGATGDAARSVQIEDPVIAYVTFESAQTAAALIQLHSMGSFEFCLRGGQAKVARPGMQNKWFSADPEAVAAASDAAKKAGLTRSPLAGGSDSVLRSSSSRRARADLLPGAMPSFDEESDDADSLPTASLTFWGLRLRLSRPPPAETIIWESLHSSPLKRASCNCVVTLFAGMLIIFSFALLYGSQVLQSSSSLLNTGSASYCAAVDVAPWFYYAPPSADQNPSAAYIGSEWFAVSPEAALSASLLGSPPVGLVNTTFALNRSFLLSAISLSAISTNMSQASKCINATSSCYSNSSALMPLKAPLCESAYIAWSDHPCAPFANGTTTAAAVKAVAPNSLTLLLPATDAARSCKCASVMVKNPSSMLPKSIGGFSRWAFSVSSGALPVDEPNWVTCYSWVTAYLSYAGIVGAAATFAVLMNVVMRSVLSSLGKFEMHTTTDEQKVSELVRAVILQIFNTGLLVLIVSAYIPSLPVDTPGVKYTDFTNGWYTNKGPTLVISMILQGLIPPFFNLAYAIYWELRRSSCCSLTARDLGHLTELYSRPPFEYADRYAYQLTLVCVSVVYSTGIPILIPLAALSLAVSLSIDHWLFLHHHSLPPPEDAVTGDVAVAFFPYSLLLHTLIGAWMMSTPGLNAIATGTSVTSDALIVAATTPNTVSVAEFAADIRARMQQAHVAPFLLGAALWFFYIFVRLCVLYFFGPIASAAMAVLRQLRRCARLCYGVAPPPSTSAVVSRRDCCGREQQQNAEGDAALLTDIKSKGDLVFFRPTLKWISRVAAARDARGETPAFTVSSPEHAASPPANPFAGAAASTQSSGGAPLSRSGKQASTDALMAERAKAADDKAERGLRQRACFVCLGLTACCMCMAVRDSCIWVWFICCSRARAARNSDGAPRLGCCAKKKEAPRSRSRSSSRRSRSSRRLASEDGDDAKITVKVEPPPPCRVYCCGGWVRLFRCCEKRSHPSGPSVGTVSDDGRNVLLPPPRFSTAVSLQLLRGTTVTFSPLESPLVVSTMLPELTSERATLAAQHRSIGRAAIFGLARVSAPFEATSESEMPMNPWNDGDPGESLRSFVRGRGDSLGSSSYGTGSYDDESSDDPSPMLNRSPRSPRQHSPRAREIYEL